MCVREGQPPTLAARIAADDEHAFRQLFDREAAGLVRHVARMLGTREEAREVAQESFFRLWQSRHRLAGCAEPARLLFTIARNLARDRLRHRAVERRTGGALERACAVDTDLLGNEGSERDELITIVERALKRLSPRQREILLLRWRRQLTYGQIAAELGIAPGTASAHMQRAIAHLQQAMRSLTDL